MEKCQIVTQFLIQEVIMPPSHQALWCLIVNNYRYTFSIRNAEYKGLVIWGYEKRVFFQMWKMADELQTIALNAIRQ